MDYSKRLTEVLAAVGMRVTPHSEDSEADLKSMQGEGIFWFKKK